MSLHERNSLNAGYGSEKLFNTLIFLVFIFGAYPASAFDGILSGDKLYIWIAPISFLIFLMLIVLSSSVLGIILIPFLVWIFGALCFTVSGRIVSAYIEGSQPLICGLAASCAAVPLFFAGALKGMISSGVLLRLLNTNVSVKTIFYKNYLPVLIAGIIILLILISFIL